MPRKTDTQRRVLALAAERKSQGQIARELGVSVGTVSVHICRLQAKGLLTRGTLLVAGTVTPTDLYFLLRECGEFLVGTALPFNDHARAKELRNRIAAVVEARAEAGR